MRPDVGYAIVFELYYSIKMVEATVNPLASQLPVVHRAVRNAGVQILLGDVCIVQHHLQGLVAEGLSTQPRSRHYAGR